MLGRASTMCGAMIIGLPRHVFDTSDGPIRLPTEYAHIEGALAVLNCRLFCLLKPVCLIAACSFMGARISLLRFPTTRMPPGSRLTSLDTRCPSSTRKFGSRRTTGGVFLFTRDDSLEGEDELAAPRDNVVFEAGFFAHAKGRERVLIIREKGAKIPADLGGNIYAMLSDKTNIGPLEARLKRFLETAI